MGIRPAPAQLAVRTTEIADPGALLAHLPHPDGLAWIRRGDGLVAWGEAARYEIKDQQHCAQAAAWWQDFVGDVDVDDEVSMPGTGPVAFGSFAFDAETHTSVLVVPRIVVGRRDGRAWLTTIGADDGMRAMRRHPVRRPVGVRWAEGSVPVTMWQSAVAEAVRRITAGELAKVVLARDLLAHTDEPVDTRFLLDALSGRFPDCWTFAVDGLVGATPELLVRRTGSDVLSLVLAGTAWRHPGAENDDLLAAELSKSAKNREEHAYSTRSAAEALAAYCTELTVPDTPTILRLSNLLHLATEVTGRLRQDTDALTLAGALHPTAAVAGTPTDAALALIRELEGMDRERYAGPVGWLDANGDGEWGIALRCAEVSGNRVRLFAGCGIVAGSDPDSELAEAQAKFVAIRDALES